MARNEGQIARREEGVGAPPVPVQPDNAGQAGFFTPSGPASPNPVTQAMNFFKNPFPALGATIKNAFTNQLPKPPIAPSAFYQVRDQDKSLSQVASSLNVPLASVVGANGGITSLPPAGSYIKARFDAEQTPQKGIGGLPPDMRPSSPAAIAAQTEAQFRSDSAVVLDNLILKQGYVPNNQLVPAGTQIPLDMWAAAGMGPLDAQALGGKLVGNNLVFGGGAVSGGGKPARDRKGNLIRNPSQVGNRGERGGEVPVLPDNASAVPMTVLALRVGSG